ncbi:MAG: prepilin-type N-terminal cleavage/methylation domain-containing protein [Planctomycetota bacterium]
MTDRSLARRRAGFTLVELIVVVAVLGLLAAVAMPKFSGVADESRRSAFAAQLGTFVDALETYHAEHGSWPSDSPTRQMPSELSPYLNAAAWESRTPLDGEWDFEPNVGGVTAAVGVQYYYGTPVPADLEAVDAVLDDGNTETGSLRWVTTDRFYFVLEE